MADFYRYLGRCRARDLGPTPLRLHEDRTDRLELARADVAAVGEEQLVCRSEALHVQGGSSNQAVVLIGTAWSAAAVAATEQSRVRAKRRPETRCALGRQIIQPQFVRTGTEPAPRGPRAAGAPPSAPDAADAGTQGAAAGRSCGVGYGGTKARSAALVPDSVWTPSSRTAAARRPFCRMARRVAALAIGT